MDDRELLRLLKRGLTMMARDPSAGDVQRRGLLLMIAAIDKRSQALGPAQAAQPARKTSQSEPAVVP
jgi:hypothetical protein